MRRPPRRSRLNPGRLAAARVLIAVEGGGHADELLASLAPTGEDRGLAWHLVLGVLRRRGALDAALAPCLRQAIDALDPPVRTALRLGMFEIALARTPRHAAVDQAVEVCRATGAPRAAGLVNAVLRKVDTVSDDPWLDLPPWLAQRWKGMDAWVSRLADPATLCGCWAGAPVPELATAPVHAGGVPIPDAFRVVDPKGAVDALPGFAEGAWWVMDPAAARVADLAVEAAGPGGRVLDACAAPGGKSFRLHARGTLPVAVDLQPHRLELLRQGASRLGISFPVHLHDWLDGACASLPRDFDVVLVDAPCSALGTVRRNPEIRWLRLPSDPAAMALRQRPILAAAAQHVRPGGALVYAVCSPLPEEGEQVARQLPGWGVEHEWRSVPPQADEDAFQAFVLRQEG